MSGRPEVYSQPKNTGAGIHATTQLFSAIEALKRQNGPVRLEDLALSNNLASLLDQNGVLFQRFKTNERVIHDPKVNLWSYKPDYDIRKPSDVVDVLRTRFLEGSKPMMKIAELRESYPDARAGLEELAKHKPPEDREVLVLRNKDQTIKYAVWNPTKGEDVRRVDEEFRTLWNAQKVPDDAEMDSRLQAEGLTAQTSAAGPIPSAGRGNAKRGRGKRGGAAGSRQARLQNTHTGVDFLQDYVKEDP
ncbi:unnamed protein product [Tilletia controversa]|uniref:TFIIE beta domain-containing protein n=3 Tax=Tilletia TaxID=13289 RepID=A0A8X7SUG4_9BASI|nr:hypothetical protein CF336_g7137 [Tilletia laevis]KAE8189970.1 hypothetical protein CF328_g6116 [Tilletia controversa]KAE8250134.1 hypothetical protein A4X03_0g6512 [Tilletia caries]KAE8189809.1 hypothetical protein CF335_g6527 [Tilletia laevis]KAE8242196.1 hypothetical protein A4X06_0g7140 [Tilletia controversa]